MDRILSRLIVPIVFGAVVFVALAAWSNFRAVHDSLLAMRWTVIPAVLALSFGNYAIRFVRWEYYLGRLRIERSTSDSMIIFLSGLVMSVSPGKFGEVFKSFLLRQRYGTPLALSAPIVLAERLTDLFALLILAAVGAVHFGKGVRLVVVGMALIAAFLAVLSSPRLVHGLIGLAGRVPRIARLTEKLVQLYDSAARLLGPVPLVVGNLYGVLGWFCECIGFYLVLGALGSPVPLGFASFAYALATIAGALTMLPGGIGLTEGSLTVLLTTQGVDSGRAVAATFVIRLCTLWFAVLVGAVVLLAFQGRFRGLPVEALEASQP
jgi:glycosyltransferase 2 family protein